MERELEERKCADASIRDEYRAHLKMQMLRAIAQFHCSEHADSYAQIAFFLENPFYSLDSTSSLHEDKIDTLRVILANLNYVQNIEHCSSHTNTDWEEWIATLPESPCKTTA